MSTFTDESKAGKLYGVLTTFNVVFIVIGSWLHFLRWSNFLKVAGITRTWHGFEIPAAYLLCENDPTVWGLYVIQTWHMQYCCYCAGFGGSPQLSPFLADFCPRISPYPYCNLCLQLKWSKSKRAKTSKNMYSNTSGLFGIFTSDEAYSNVVFHRQSYVAHKSKHRSS